MLAECVTCWFSAGLTCYAPPCAITLPLVHDMSLPWVICAHTSGRAVNCLPNKTPTQEMDEAMDEATALFAILDSNDDGTISKIELIDFCSMHSVNVARLTKALQLDQKTVAHKDDFMAKFNAGELNFMKGTAIILARRNTNEF